MAGRKSDPDWVEWFPSKVNYLLLKSPYPLFSLLLQKNILIRDCSNYEGLEKGVLPNRGETENRQ